MAQRGSQEQPPGPWGRGRLRADLYIYLQEDESQAGPRKPCPLTGGDKPEAPSPAAARGPMPPPVSPQGFSSRQRAHAALEQTHSPVVVGLGHGKSQNWGAGGAPHSLPQQARLEAAKPGEPKGLGQREGGQGREAEAEPASPSLAGLGSPRTQRGELAAEAVPVCWWSGWSDARGSAVQLLCIRLPHSS